MHTYPPLTHPSSKFHVSRPFRLSNDRQTEKRYISSFINKYTVKNEQRVINQYNIKVALLHLFYNWTVRKGMNPLPSINLTIHPSELLTAYAFIFAITPLMFRGPFPNLKCEALRLQIFFKCMFNETCPNTVTEDCFRG